MTQEVKEFPTGLPVKVLDITDTDVFVPYTGATTNVDLGAHNLTVDTNTLFVDSAGNKVGIGTILPTLGMLQITAGGQSTYIDTAGSSGVSLGASASLVLRAGSVSSIYYDGVNHYLRSQTGATTYMTIDTNGSVGIGTAPSTAYKFYVLAGGSSGNSQTSAINVYWQNTDVAKSGTAGLTFNSYLMNTAGKISTQYGVFGYAISLMTGTGTAGTVSGLYGAGRQMSANTVDLLCGSNTYVLCDASTGTVAEAVGFYAYANVGASSTMTARYGVHVLECAGTGTVTTQIGLKIDDLTKGGTDWSIYTGVAPCHFGGDVEVTGDLTVSGTIAGFLQVDGGYSGSVYLTDQSCDGGSA